MKVKNINGTSQNTCKCGSWLDHWKKFGKTSLPAKCSEVSCSYTPEVGAHVLKDIPTDNNWYIIPLCKTHNSKLGESIIIKDSVILVSANVTNTCG